MRLWATAHAVDDFYQGLVPALVPFFVLERGYSYLGASGLALAATLGSAVPQLAVGVISDRRRVVLMAPTGIALAGLGVGLTGLINSYTTVFALLLLSGFGVAMFHPPAGRDARVAAGDSAGAMSYFAVGGTVGFFLAPAVATPALHRWGLGVTVWFIVPAALMAYVLARTQLRVRGRASTREIEPAGTDRWGMFGVLTAIEIVRSTVSFGVNTFVSLYWINHLGASASLGGSALTLELVGGTLGAVLGGRIADRFGLVTTVRAGNALLPLAIGAMLVCHDRVAALPLVFLVGLVAAIPFAVLVKLGQDYLPSRPATAAGVTLGLAVSAGGLLMPALGVLADSWGIVSVFVTLAVIPILATGLSFALVEPGTVRGRMPATQRR